MTWLWNLLCAFTHKQRARGEHDVNESKVSHGNLEPKVKLQGQAAKVRHRYLETKVRVQGQTAEVRYSDLEPEVSA